MILVKGIVAAGRSVMVTLGLLAIILYVFGVAFAQLCEDTEVGKAYFDGVFGSMYTLATAGTLMDGPTVVASALAQTSYFHSSLFFVFLLISSLTVMNMLIGVICEVVADVSATEREEMTVDYITHKLYGMLVGIDTDSNNMISKDEFLACIEHREAALILHDVGIDVVNLIDFTDAIFESFLAKDENRELVNQHVHGHSSATEYDEFEKRMCECGNELLSDASFCRQCGKKWVPVRSLTGVHRMCNCGNELAEDAQFCRKCGQQWTEDGALMAASHISFHHLMDEVLRLRGCNQATVRDLMDLQRYMRKCVDELGNKIDTSTRRLETRIDKALNAAGLCAVGASRTMSQVIVNNLEQATSSNSCPSSITRRSGTADNARLGLDAGLDVVDLPSTVQLVM
jgi:ribosomal protein L40E